MSCLLMSKLWQSIIGSLFSITSISFPLLFSPFLSLLHCIFPMTLIFEFMNDRALFSRHKQFLFSFLYKEINGSNSVKKFAFLKFQKYISNGPAKIKNVGILKSPTFSTSLCYNLQSICIN